MKGEEEEEEDEEEEEEEISESELKNVQLSFEGQPAEQETGPSGRYPVGQFGPGEDEEEEEQHLGEEGEAGGVMKTFQDETGFGDLGALGMTALIMFFQEYGMSRSDLLENTPPPGILAM